MSLNIFWFLPTHGDGHYLGTAEGARAVDHGYLQQVAQAAHTVTATHGPLLDMLTLRSGPTLCF